jgi:hypothetical protein
MRYFYDTEFHDDGKTIDLISIGIVAEDGREYYAVNDDANWPRIGQNEWLVANVVPQLLPVVQWKPRAQIAVEVHRFLTVERDGRRQTPELWADYSAYDHVALAQMFGPMVALPDFMPMFTNDLRTLLTITGYKEQLPAQGAGQHDALQDARHLKRLYEKVTEES